MVVVVVVIMRVEEWLSLILIGDQETARLMEQAITSSNTSARTSTRHQVGIRHAVKVGTGRAHALLYKFLYAVTGG